jgi:branched-chain amino acid transport system ATP-binding protein
MTGETVALLGANGAGKTTTLRSVMALISKREGRVELDGRDITSASPEAIVKQGMTLVPEGRHIFARLTVVENLRMGIQGRGGSRPVEGAPSSIEDIYEVFPILGERRAQRAGTLSGGEQQQLAIARALMSWPKVLLLDEPSLGLAPKLAEDVFDMLKRLGQSGLTILIVEQNVSLGLDIATRAYVLANGQVRLEGSAEKLRDSTGIERTYLGMGSV